MYKHIIFSTDNKKLFKNIKEKLNLATLEGRLDMLYSEENNKGGIFSKTYHYEALFDLNEPLNDKSKENNGFEVLVRDEDKEYNLKELLAKVDLQKYSTIQNAKYIFESHTQEWGKMILKLSKQINTQCSKNNIETNASWWRAPVNNDVPLEDDSRYYKDTSSLRGHVFGDIRKVLNMREYILNNEYGIRMKTNYFTPQ